VFVNALLSALARAAAVVDIPGAPRSLRLDAAEVVDDGVRVRWSFLDPEGSVAAHDSDERRVHGELRIPSTRGATDELARSWWARAQLDAAYRYKQQIDADWIPGKPFLPKVWTTEEAWQALLTSLGSGGDDVRVERGEIRVDDGTEVVTYRIDPDAWAAFLTGPDTGHAQGETPIVPAAHPLVDGLPLWAVDELNEVVGAFGPVVGLVAGQLVGIEAGES